MDRRWFACFAVGLLAAAAGCTMCANPYDECGPMSKGRNGGQCRGTARAGSILSAPTDSSMIVPSSAVEQMPTQEKLLPGPDSKAPPSGTPTPAPQKPGPMPSGRLPNRAGSIAR